jgi:hypothetical protein
MVELDMITCRDCGEVKPRNKAQTRQCRECYNSYMRDYNIKNREKVLKLKRDLHSKKRKDPVWVDAERKRGRDYHNRIRHEVMMAYGGYRCACCGETEPAFLSIDHIKNDGAEHRRQISSRPGNGKGASGPTWKWIIDNGFPEGFQVLCMNCNFGKARNGGICPHHKAPQP